MKSLVKLITLAAVVLIGAWSIRASFAAPGANYVEPHRATPAPASTESIYRQKCSKCHGADGTGDTSMGRIFNAPDFTDAGWSAKHSNTSELIKTITRGKKSMPAFGRKLTRAQITALASYVQRFKR
jgi:mono/diheme cytochrome c family protein